MVLYHLLILLYLSAGTLALVSIVIGVTHTQETCSRNLYHLIGRLCYESSATRNLHCTEQLCSIRFKFLVSWACVTPVILISWYSSTCVSIVILAVCLCREGLWKMVLLCIFIISTIAVFDLSKLIVTIQTPVNRSEIVIVVVYRASW